MFTNQDFESMNWHDNALHAFRIIENEDGAGHLILDIDYINEWIPPEDNSGAYSFRVTPSDLIFLNVSDLVIAIDYKSSTAVIQPMIIHEIQREAITYPNGYASYRWTIDISWPANGEITFNASEFNQVPRKEPVITGAQYLSHQERMQ